MAQGEMILEQTNYLSYLLDIVRENLPEYHSFTIVQNQLSKKHVSLIKCTDRITGQEEVFVVKSFGITGTNYQGDTFDSEIQGYDEAYKIIPENMPRRIASFQVENKVSAGIIIYERIRARGTTVNDLPACKEVFNKLHKEGVIHGDSDCINVLVRILDGRIMLIDFAQTKIFDLNDPEFLEQKILEMRILEERIGDCSEC